MSTIRLEDWRHASADRVAPLHAAEVARWASMFDWDAARIFEQVEQGRRFGHVRGVLATNTRGGVEGWCFYLTGPEALQVGGFVASSDACSNAMLNAIFARDFGSPPASVTFFAYSDAPGLAAALRTRGLSVDRYFYLGRDLSVDAPYPMRDARRWQAADAPAAAELLQRAYVAGDEARPFAPHGSSSEWAEYVAQLTTGAGCGELVEEACISLPLGPCRLSGLALVSRISPSTAHLVQLAIDPSIRRRGYGASVLLAACTAARRAGFRRMTMMVSGRNLAARRMYEAARFEAATSVIAAGSTQPLRSTSVAGSGAAASLR